MPLTNYEKHLIKEVHYQITTHMPTPINLSLLIAETNISPTTFIKGYKSLFSKTPSQHRIEVMMQYSEKRLLEGAQVKQVAIELGYSTAQNFSRIFKKIKGHPPSKLVQT